MPSLTRLVKSVTRVVLVAPCLLLLILVCSACVTFPLNKLEVGMTMTQATEAFGEPSSTSIGELHQAVQLLQSDNARIYKRLESAVELSETRGLVARRLEELATRTLHTLERFVAELDAASGEQGIRSIWVYPHKEFDWIALDIAKKEVELLFEGNELVSWETRSAPSVPSTGTYFYQSPYPSTMTFPSKDSAHHAKGHKHHHGHGC